MDDNNKHFMMGNEILATAALDAGAKMMFAYPITPSTEILETWVNLCEKNPQLKYQQSEDEMAAGFGVIGSCLAGVPAFTATAGPGNVLMQDAFSMAEALRIPTVAMIMQRGGLSTSTVIYSQEEVALTCFGGNGEGFRIVYSPSSLQELYDLTQKAFRVAWQYRFPTFILGDGYLGKMKGAVEIKKQESGIMNYGSILQEGVNLRNCYNLEEEIGEIILNYSDDFAKMRTEIEEAEDCQSEGAETVVMAHGIVAAAAKVAVENLQKQGVKVGLFRPITLRPFPTTMAGKVLENAKQIITFESALGQMARLFKDELYWINVPLTEVNKPAVGFTPEEIEKTIKNYLT
ncbi:ferredoxin oxidoreductase [Candidatus Microgenomates bacterium]|nr:ferredoxin oxidoreductase [Candidatus Microgenomates bacterium]